MFDSLFLSLREGLEAALIIGIILAHLVRIERKDLMKVVYIGAILGFIVCAVVGVIGFNEAQGAEEGSEEIFEGIMMLLSAGLIAYFILWLHRNQNNTSSVTGKINKNTSAVSLLVLSFLSVFREGTELVIFNLTKITENAAMVALGSVIGILLAIIIAAVIFKASIKLNLKLIFKFLGIVLIFVGGEMFGEGLVKLFEGGEALEMTGMITFIVLSLIVFLKQDIQLLIKNEAVQK
ncbi:high-affinity iron transporter [Scopulibacillus darangshiensis]|uniref:High-affinity iron transporter n=1 Tax=Scopulibacillus darangshiensis TaxID=442528 RepID=A0A4R2NEF7_9BACL|nr:FTR1 family protein [Scopulibacillus darangshiensis]TCP19498.1 high-affinity iron transporter [Scopulibacillus darangshiensis]